MPKPAASSKMSNSRLLSLPPEIRDRIYGFVLLQHSPLQPNVAKLFTIAEKHEATNVPYDPETILPIARTCKQLCHEALSVYYGGNTFEFSGTYDLYVFLYMIGSDRRRCIKNISFTYRGLRQKQAFELLGDCTQLRRLHIAVSHETTKGCRRPQRNLLEAKGLRVLRGLRGFKNLRVWVEERGGEVYAGCRGLEDHYARLSQRYFTDDQVAGLEELLNSELVDRS